MLSAYFINIPPAGQFLHRPESLVPAAAHDPFGGLGGFHSSANTIAKVSQRPRAHKIHRQPLEAGAGQVQMSVIESRHYEMAVQINDLSFFFKQKTAYDITR